MKALPEPLQTSLMTYIHLLDKWNKAYNLTAIRDPKDMESLHILDSLAIGPFLQGDHIIDVGTGPGLPGIPLALAFPEKHFTLLDSNGKKTRFLTHVQQTLDIKNIAIVQERAEKFKAPILFDSVLSRAFASLTDMINMTAHLCTPDGRFLAMKGQYPEGELKDLPDSVIVEAIHPLKVIGLDAQRHLVVLKLH